MTRMDVWRAASVLATAVAWVGCSDDGAGVSPGGADSGAGGAKPTQPTAELVAACDTIAKARCAVAASCCKDAATSAECEATASKRCTDDVAASHAALQAGTAKVSTGAAAACVGAVVAQTTSCLPPQADLASASCGAVVEDPAAAEQPCKSAVAGLSCAAGKGRCTAPDGGKPSRCALPVAVGQPCDHALCEVGARCVQATAGATKTCEKPGKTGSLCAAHADCAAGLTCGAAGTCTQGASDGASCTGAGTCALGSACDDTQGKCVPQVKLGEGCLAHRHCLQGLACAGLGLSGSCVEQSAIGAKCSRSADCAGGLFCDPKSAKCAPQTDDGAPCTTSDGCSALLYCDVTDKQCKALPGEGEACAYSVRTCLPGLTCYQPTKKDRTCVKPRGKGEKCTTHNNCVAGLGCDFGTGLCVDLPANGKACFDGTYCKDGYCDHDDNTCRAWLASGKACKGGHECGPDSACVGTTVANLVCKPKPAKGQACLLECQQGLFCAVAKVAGTCQPAVCAM